jgi:hypothetical protein
MTLEELKALLDAVELRNFPYRVEIRSEIRDWFDLFGDRQPRIMTTAGRRVLVVCFDQYIPNRDTGVIGKFTMESGLDERQIENFGGSTIDALDLFVRSKLFEMVTHEVSEAIHYKGERIFDPHRPEALGFTPAPPLPAFALNRPEE